jgi:hypothetical protein
MLSTKMKLKEYSRYLRTKKVVALLTVGIPAESPAARARKALEDIVTYISTLEIFNVTYRIMLQSHNS